MANPHDTLFREVFRDPDDARDLVLSALPPRVADALGRAPWVRVGGSFVDPELIECHADLLFETRAAGDDPVLIYVLLEHKSNRDPETPFQLLRYVVRIWERWRADHRTGLLPPVLPFVLHHGERAWEGAPRLHDRIAFARLPVPLAGWLRDLIPDLGFVLDDLAAATEDDLEVRATSALAGLCLRMLQHLPRLAPDAVPVAIARWQRLIAAVLRQRGQDALVLLWSYVFHTTEVGPADALVRIRPLLRRPLEESVMSTAERLRREGRAEGHAEGHAQGRAEMLLRLIERRFGSLTPDVTARVRAARDDQLERWADALFTAPSLTELLDR